MMKMKIKIDEEKAKTNSEYTVEEMYKKIDDLAKSEGITRKDSKGFFIDNEDKDYFANFGNLILDLKECEWFMPYVEEWIWYVDGEVDDVAEFYRQKRKAV